MMPHIFQAPGWEPSASLTNVVPHSLNLGVGASVGAAQFAALLAAVSACGAHAVRLEDKSSGKQIPLALRSVIVTDGELFPMIADIAEALFAVERAEIDAFLAGEPYRAAQRDAEIAHQKLFAQLAVASSLLGKGLPDEQQQPQVMKESVETPVLVTRNGARKEMLQAAATTTKGLINIDDQKMASLAGFGGHFDKPTADLVNSAAFRAIEVTDDRSRKTIRNAPISLIGVAREEDRYWAYRFDPGALRASLFIYAAEASGTSPQHCNLILQRVRMLPRAERPLGLSAGSRKMLQKLGSATGETLAPMSLFNEGLPDTALRIAHLLHLIKWATCDELELPGEIADETVQQTVAFLKEIALPHARQFLAFSSVPMKVNIARRIVSHVQRDVVPEKNEYFHRSATISLQREAVRDVHDAIEYLVQIGLLTTTTPSGKPKLPGPCYAADSAVFDHDNRLPDLITDRRKK
jgi:hypothetical protein